MTSEQAHLLYRIWSHAAFCESKSQRFLWTESSSLFRKGNSSRNEEPEQLPPFPSCLHTAKGGRHRSQHQLQQRRHPAYGGSRQPPERMATKGRLTLRLALSTTYVWTSSSRASHWLTRKGEIILAEDITSKGHLGETLLMCWTETCFIDVSVLAERALLQGRAKASINGCSAAAPKKCKRALERLSQTAFKQLPYTTEHQVENSGCRLHTADTHRGGEPSVSIWAASSQFSKLDVAQSWHGNSPMNKTHRAGGFWWAVRCYFDDLRDYSKHGRLAYCVEFLYPWHKPYHVFMQQNGL